MINSVSVTEVIRSLDRRKGARGGGPSCGAMDNPVEQRRIRDFWEITRRQEEFQRELRRLKAVEVYLSVTLSLSLSLCVCVCVCVCVRVCVFVLECVFMFVPLYLHPSFTLAFASWALPSQALAPRLHALPMCLLCRRRFTVLTCSASRVSWNTWAKRAVPTWHS